MKKYIILISIVPILACNSSGNQSNPADVDHTNIQREPVIVYDTIPEKLNKGEQLLSEARKKLEAQRNTKINVQESESKKLASLFLMYQDSQNLSEKQLEGFLAIDPKDLRNSAELSEMYNEALFKVINNNNRLFARQLIRRPNISERLALDLSNPVNDEIKKDLILGKTRKEYELQIDNRINEIEDERLIMQYYTEKKKVYSELEGEESAINTPQKVRDIDRTRIREFESNYKVENRIPDTGMGFRPSTLPQSEIGMGNIKIDLEKLRQNIRLNQNINQRTIQDLQRSNRINRREGGG